MPLAVGAGRLPPVNPVDLQERFARVRDRVAEAAIHAGREPDAVTVVAVTKGHPVATVRAVLEAGFTHIGENRVSAAAAKRLELADADASWHLVGHLQRNKAARAVDTFDRVDSVDSVRLAQKLSSIIEGAEREQLEVLVQVNASGEASKYGVELDDAAATVAGIAELPGLRVAGLMTMAPYGAGDRMLSDVFRATRECLEACRRAAPGRVGAELSMGMSEDFEIAIHEGATQVRLGTALLGERPGTE